MKIAAVTLFIGLFVFLNSFELSWQSGVPGSSKRKHVTLPEDAARNDDTYKVVVKMKNGSKYFEFVDVYRPGQQLRDLIGQRPLWMSFKRRTTFQRNSIYIEMRQGPRYYTSGPLRMDPGHPDQDSTVNFPDEADLKFGLHTYVARNFEDYTSSNPGPNAAAYDYVGRIFITIKDTQSIQFANIVCS